MRTYQDRPPRIGLDDARAVLAECDAAVKAVRQQLKHVNRKRAAAARTVAYGMAYAAKADALLAGLANPVADLKLETPQHSLWKGPFA